MEEDRKQQQDSAPPALLGQREEKAVDITCPAQLLARARELGFSAKELTALMRLYGKTNILNPER